MTDTELDLEELKDKLTYRVLNSLEPNPTRQMTGSRR